MSEDPIIYDGEAKPPTTNIFTVIMWKDEKGQMMEENVPPFGWALPESVPRFIGVATALAQQLGQPASAGVPIPYRFPIVADTPQQAFDQYPALAQSEGQKAYNRWAAAQAGQRVAVSGQFNGRR